ncbi:MAG: hypothetical protein JWO80_3486, partial [Bryobacterales bacterium]|nr:hypothetical protein [Bryobacterales bacterium]
MIYTSYLSYLQQTDQVVKGNEGPLLLPHICKKVVVDRNMTEDYHLPEHATGDGIVLTHGAGGNREMPLLILVAKGLAKAGITVLRFDLPFRQKRPHGPPHPSG